MALKARASISVIVPVRNQAAKLRVCLEHLAKSEEAPFEVLVTDDASTDDSAEVAHDAGARVLSQPNRIGPAAARNLAAKQALGEVLFFVDADVAVRSDAVGRVAALFSEQPHIAAVIGSYDNDPASDGFISQYKNLLHHFVHQHGRKEASSFWSGCGAVRKSAFLATGGFSRAYGQPSIEDIEFGYRLRRGGYHILLDRELQGKHLKHWSFLKLVHTDIFRRGVPWVELILTTGFAPSDLNLRTELRLSVVLLYAAAGLATGAVWTRGGSAALWTAASAGVVVAVVLMNLRLYRFFAERRGIGFALRAIPLHLLYHFYNGFSLVFGTARWLVLRSATRKNGAAARHNPHARESDVAL